jgi:hypothetical protein
LAIIALMFVVADLSRKNQEQANEQAKLVARINTLKQQLGQETSALDSVNTKQQTSDVKAMTYIESIEQKLTTINNYLANVACAASALSIPKPTVLKRAAKNYTPAMIVT